MDPTLITNHVNPMEFLTRAAKAVTNSDLEALLSRLPITPEDDYIFQRRTSRSWMAEWVFPLDPGRT